MTAQPTDSSDAIQNSTAPDSGGRLGLTELVDLVRAILAGCWIVLGLFNIPKVLLWLSPSFIYQKDMICEYLVARAIASQTDPFLPIQVLAGRYLTGPAISTFDHPTPHPPTLALLSYPLVFLDYPTAATVWLVLEVISLVAAIYLLGRLAGFHLPVGWTLSITIMSLAWFPVLQELQRGQVGILLLLLLTGFYLSLRSNRFFVGGMLLGISILVKQIAWPVIILLLLRKRWNILLGAASVVLPGYLLMLQVIGFGSLARYFVEVLPQVSALYRNLIWNFSLWTIGFRLFGGTTGIISPPLVQLPSAAPIASVVVPAIALLVACYLTRTPFDLEWGIGVMLCLSTVVNPVAWPHYLVIMLPIVALVTRQLIGRGFPMRETSLAFLVGALLFVDHPRWEIWAFNIAGQTPAIEGGLSVLPFAPALFLLGPVVAVTALAWLCLILGRQGHNLEWTPKVIGLFH